MIMVTLSLNPSRRPASTIRWACCMHAIGASSASSHRSRGCAAICRSTTPMPMRAAARAILRYFDEAAPHHHADEEDSLFPRLTAAAPEIATVTNALQRDHRRLDAQWRKLRPLLAAIATGNGAHLPGKGVAAFCDAYTMHLQREEADLLPVAAELLDAASLRAIGEEMAQRRASAPGKPTRAAAAP
jgi:hemerythrin-like domain-containing protein